jgi:hypothetical protein
MGTVFENQAVLLKIYAADNDYKDGLPVGEWIVRKSCEMGLAGASVFRGLGGFFANEPIVAPEFFNFHLERPVLIEIVDQADKIEKFAVFLKDEVEDLLLVRVPVETFTT